ncbi:hypothetical protein [Parapedobacter sp. DT-150]|uniref:hypothetical protein n=1 Tax=Parapedobacter sp. DT-150 TaxID=3396162 RepID=UPI003F1C37E0
MNSFFIFIPILLYVGIIVAFVYAIYRMVDGWVEKSVSVRREQNALLAKLINNLEKKDGD